MTDDHGDVPGGDDLAAAYGEDYASVDEFTVVRPKRTQFAPWHHPVKQRVRTSQWQMLVHRLISTRNMNGGTLRYFTLPGPDLLDVRVLADICAPQSVAIEYFGFDAALQASNVNNQRFEIESALRQSSKITDQAIIYPDQLQDIALSNSQAARQLSQQRPFDVVNVDACDHLAYAPADRGRSLFDALRSLLAHQMDATAPWLLFVTTRAEPELMEGPGVELRRAVNDNLNSNVGGFGLALAGLFETDEATIADAVANIWAVPSDRFLKLYALGLTKYLLQFFLAQPNRPANVELASTCAYRVFRGDPDMLALAFRITPGPRVVFEPGEQPPSTAALEVERAINAAERAKRLRDLDRELADNPDLCLEAARGSAVLLSASNYDIEAYAQWLRTHEQRPLHFEAASLR